MRKSLHNSGYIWISIMISVHWEKITDFLFSNLNMGVVCVLIHNLQHVPLCRTIHIYPKSTLLYSIIYWVLLWVNQIRISTCTRWHLRLLFQVIKILLPFVAIELGAANHSMRNSFGVTPFLSSNIACLIILQFPSCEKLT